MMRPLRVTLEASPYGKKLKPVPRMGHPDLTNPTLEVLEHQDGSVKVVFYAIPD